MYRIATWALVVLAGLYAVALRLYLAWELPLWLDESWTAILSSAPTLQSFARQMWLDSNAPLYYLLMWVWPFEGNLGLKLPSLIFMLGAAAIAAWWRPPGLSRQAGWFWAFLLLVWQPGITLFIDARYYALLILVSTAQTVAYLHLLGQPTRRSATLWTSIATLAILTHYFAAIPALVQGLYFLWRHRGRALRCWPAMLTALPAFAWGLYHFPRLRLYAQPGIGWYELILPKAVPDYLFWPIGGTVLIGGGVLIVAFLFRLRTAPVPNVLPVAGLAAVSAVILIAAGLIAPMFIGRYLLPTAPPILLAVAASIRPAGYLPMAIWYFANMGGMFGLANQLDDQASYGLEKPARLLPDARVVTWMIDYGGSKIHDRAQMESMLADAFRRNRRVVEPRWSNDLLGGDGLIYFYRSDESAVVGAIKAKWRCIDLHSLGHRGVACARRYERIGQ